MQRQQLFYSLSVQSLSSFYNRLVYQKRASKSAIFYVLIAMLGVYLMATKGDLSQLSMTPLALITGLLSAMGVMFNVILPQPFAKRYGFVPTVGWGMILAGLFSNVLSPVYQLSFTPDIWSILICLIIAFFGTAFAFFISMRLCPWFHLWWFPLSVPVNLSLLPC